MYVFGSWACLTLRPISIMMLLSSLLVCIMVSNNEIAVLSVSKDLDCSGPQYMKDSEIVVAIWNLENNLDFGISKSNFRDSGLWLFQNLKCKPRYSRSALQRSTRRYEFRGAVILWSKVAERARSSYIDWRSTEVQLTRQRDFRTKGRDFRARGGAAHLVQRFDIEPYSDFSARLSNFIGLVLFCIDAKFCKKTFVGKLLTRSTRFTCFCTAQTSIFQKIFVKLFRIFWQNFVKICRKCGKVWRRFSEILRSEQCKGM